jgi:hypothetical protein
MTLSEPQQLPKKHRYNFQDILYTNVKGVVPNGFDYQKFISPGVDVMTTILSIFC